MRTFKEATVCYIQAQRVGKIASSHSLISLFAYLNASSDMSDSADTMLSIENIKLAPSVSEKIPERYVVAPVIEARKNEAVASVVVLSARPFSIFVLQI